MTGTIDHPHFRVVDEFLDEDDWSAVWTHLQFVELLPVSRSLGAWKLDDGVPLGGHERVVERGDTKVGDDPIERVLASIAGRPELHAGLVDDDWTHVSARPYVYPRETGLSWHVDDHELYAGAFIYYAHPRWNAHWGGELLIAELDTEADEAEPLDIMAYRFETEDYSERLLDMGCGNFVMPKPNRLVVLAGAPHMVARVSPAAGHNVRASISGFFLRSSSR